jgi:hypothetical protein
MFPLPIDRIDMALVLDDKDRHKTVAFISALVSLGIIDIEEFASVLVSIEDACIEGYNVSDSFLIALTEYYSSHL